MGARIWLLASRTLGTLKPRIRARLAAHSGTFLQECLVCPPVGLGGDTYLSVPPTLSFPPSLRPCLRRLPSSRPKFRCWCCRSAPRTPTRGSRRPSSHSSLPIAGGRVPAVVFLRRGAKRRPFQGPPAGRGAGAAHRSPIPGARGPLETPAATRSSGARLSQPAGRRRPEARGGGRHGDPLGPGPVPGASGAALTVLLPARAGSQLCPRRRSATSVSPPSLGRAAAWARRRRRRPVEWAVRARV